MADDEFKRRLDRVDALYRELMELRESAKGKEELVLAELRLDNEWRELYEFMDLPLSRESGTVAPPD